MKTSTIELNGREYTLETGRFAKYANGSVMVRYGDNMVLVTVVAAEIEKKDIDFLPLQCEYRVKLASAGKIPGGFLKREGRPSDSEVLSSRLIDRPIRPMMPKTWHFETQIIATVFSAEPDFEPGTLAMVGASAALMISNIPFSGPVSEVRVARINGEFIANPTTTQLNESDIDMTVAGNDSSIVMVEGESKEISEEDFLATLEFAHGVIRKLNELQRQLAGQLEVKKREFEIYEPADELKQLVKDTVYDELNNYVHTQTSKTERHEWRNRLFDQAFEKVKEVFSANEDFNEDLSRKDTGEIIGKLEKQLMRAMILNDGKRLDGRTTKDIRPISIEVGILPRAHGSALFTRGETQSLSTVTLGTGKDEQMIDGLLPTYTNTFYLHYNFPPYSTGEVGRLMGVGRREIGHGNLAERAIKSMLPPHEEFPYTIRIVSDILESNGSSSMATVCAGSLALFDAGVPMKKPVAGIAMGLIKEESEVAILSDILGDEDFLGDMDFKVTGTADGITACQMDIKIEGLSMEIMRTALEQARQGRMHILGLMNLAIESPREDLSQYAPRFLIMTIPQDKIGAVIGSGGETIRGIVRDTTAEIDIKDDGTILIAATSGEAGEMARKIIESIVRNPEAGETYMGEVKEIKEGIGALVEFLPRKQGLLHISQIAHERTANVSDALKVGDKLEIKLLEITPEGKFRLSRKALLPRPEGMPEEEDTYQSRPPKRYDRGSGGDRNHRDDRGRRNSGDRGDRGDRRPPRHD